VGDDHVGMQPDISAATDDRCGFLLMRKDAGSASLEPCITALTQSGGRRTAARGARASFSSTTFSCI
jgi:hypothetical protein